MKTNPKADGQGSKNQVLGITKHHQATHPSPHAGNVEIPLGHRFLAALNHLFPPKLQSQERRAAGRGWYSSGKDAPGGHPSCSFSPGGLVGSGASRDSPGSGGGAALLPETPGEQRAANPANPGI